MTEFEKFVAMEQGQIVMADNGIGVDVSFAKKAPGLEAYLIAECKAHKYLGHYVVEAEKAELYDILNTIMQVYAPVAILV